jgi:hypothetical protein
MPSTTKDTTPVSVDEGPIEARYAELDGWTVGFETYRTDVDPAPLFRGLPEDRCQATHLGIVTAGRVVYRYADHEEVYGAGDVYHATPGHLPLIEAGSELVEFTPTDELGRTMDVVMRNMQAVEAQA